MRKTFLKVSLLAVLGLGMSASFTGCKDYDGEIDRIDQQIAEMKAQIDKINALVSSGSVITSVSQNAEGVTFTLSNGQSYTVTNGKAGKDADVWTIVTNADGKLVWAKNGVATEYPAQGPAGTPGENGTAEPGIYYQPNEDGFFYKVDPAKGTSEKTDISWKAKGGALSAVATGDKVILSGIVDGEGNAAEDITIWRSMFIQSLVAVPGFYLDGIEATRYEVIVDHKVQKTVNADANLDVAAATSTQGAVILKGSPASFDNSLNANNAQIYYNANQIATLAYHVNPSNAVTEGMKWNLLIDDKEVVNRGSAVSGEVLGASDVNSNGDITITYQLSNTGRLAPYSGLTSNPTSNANWTMMALQAANPETDSALVASNNVAIVKRSVKLVHLLVSQTVSNPTWKQTWDKAEFAIAEVANSPILNGATAATPAEVLTAAYNQTYDLASHIAIETSYLDNMLGDKANVQNTTGDYTSAVMTLAQAEAKYKLSASYQLVGYTIKPNQTSEDKFAKINAETGVVTPCWVNESGAQIEIPGTTQGRSAIGRQPMVYVTLNNAAGQIVLAGFVKIKYTEPAVELPSITIRSLTFPYMCSNGAASTWEQITGAVYEHLGVTAEQFSKSYLPEGTLNAATGIYTCTVYSAPGTEATFKNLYGKDVNASVGFSGLATLTWDSNENNTHTQKFAIGLSNANYEAWYPTWNNNGSHKGYSVTTASQTRTLYAKFYNETENKTVYIGFKVTLTGAPAASYTEKLVSQWSTDMNVAPINPAVPGQTTATSPVQVATGYPYAAAMAMNFKSVWNGGLPVPDDKNYNFTNTQSAWNYINPNTIQANYSFAKQNPETIKGLSGTEYTLSVSKNGQSLLATWTDDAGKHTQPIAAISDDKGDVINGVTYPIMTDVISMLPYFEKDADGNAIVPIQGTPVYGEAACDIVNSQAFTKDAPAITFDVLMDVTYGTCELKIPGSYALEVGVGRPISLNEKNTGELQDAVTTNVQASKLFTMVDWQGHLLWNTSRSGVVTANTFNGADLAAFWLSKPDPADPSKGYQVPDAPDNANYGVTIDLDAAKVSLKSDGTEMLGEFNKVYVDKKLSFVTPAPAGVTITDGVATITTVTALGDLKITWTNSGSAVTTNIYVYVPIYITYVWGQDIYLGDAIITVKPTLSAE